MTCLVPAIQCDKVSEHHLQNAANEISGNTNLYAESPPAPVPVLSPV